MLTLTDLCKPNTARLTSGTEAGVGSTGKGIPEEDPSEEVDSVPTILEEEGAKIAENREIEDLEKRDFDDVEGINSDGD